MSPQEAVEAPRLWTEGGPVELEPAFPETLAESLAARGHPIQRVNRVAGGMNAISFDDDGLLTGPPAGARTARLSPSPVGSRGRACASRWPERPQLRPAGFGQPNGRKVLAIPAFIAMMVSMLAASSSPALRGQTSP